MPRPIVPDWCEEVGPQCPVEGTVYGYAPNLGANAFFAAFFGLCCLLSLGLGIRFKTWSYMVALTLGCGCEVAGYIGRILMHNNPYSTIGFQLQISLLIIAPAFISAGIYLTLKYFVLTFGEGWSRLRPAWYTYIFIAGDLLSLILQGAGGGIAASADPGSSALDLGTNLMIAGVAWQVVTLTIFGYLLAEYSFRTYRRRDQLSAPATALISSGKFRLFVGAVALAYICILGRCAYRVPELSDGWGSDLMRNEGEFIGLEGVLITISAAALTFVHPGYFFPALAKGKKAEFVQYSSSGEKSGNDSEGTDIVPGPFQEPYHRV